jgi:hypothetical protein
MIHCPLGRQFRCRPNALFLPEEMLLADFECKIEFSGITSQIGNDAMAGWVFARNGGKACWALVTLVATFTGCGGSEPFHYEKVSGTVTYEDGSLIPGNRVMLTFVPQDKPKDAKIHPRPGIAEADVKTGAFSRVTSHKFGDGIVRGKHKVLVASIDAQDRPTTAIPATYSSVRNTPLVIDSQDGPFHFRIPKPEKEQGHVSR